MSQKDSVDIRTTGQVRAGWWVEPKSRVPCIFTKDGLICAFRRSDVEALMDRKYPHTRRNNRKIWWFNETKDREIAELDLSDVALYQENAHIFCNPQVYWEHYQEK